MLFKRKKQEVPELNTVSTADISFMLLIFFLVTTSMETNNGIYRKLPPIDKKQQKEIPTVINTDRIMTVQIKKGREIMVDGKVTPINIIKMRVLSFIERNGTQHFIQIRTERDATYNEYFQVQNAILSAYNTIRDKRGLAQFGRVYELCSREQQALLEEEVPERISEVYLVNNITTSQEK